MPLRHGRRNSGQTATVRTLTASSARGLLLLGNRVFPCTLGRSGCRVLKREGDGATPIGKFSLRDVLWRPDRGLPPRTGLLTRPIRPTDGWCDAVGDRNYNRPVRHPYRASAEHLWRADHLYDIVVVLAANTRPRIQGRGSAIFMHLARPDGGPTAGCVALSRRDLRLVLGQLRRGSHLVVTR